MKISASIYSGNRSDLRHTVSELDALHVDMFHIDCNDDETVFNDIKQIKSLSQTPIDLHVITPTPSKYWQLISECKPGRVSFQLEDLEEELIFPADNEIEWGIAIKTPTDISTFEKFKDSAQFALIMATTPGQSGGVFNRENFQKIRDFRRNYPNHGIEVDGGVNDEVSFILRNYGVHVAVVGSYLMKHDVQGRALSLLKHEQVDSHFLVKDMMITKAHLPVLNISNQSVVSILETNEQYKMGYCLFIDDSGHFMGISTNADMRKGLLKHPENFNELKASEIINAQAIRINENRTIKEMFQLLRSKNQTISYLPVINDQGQLTGAINFNTLIKGEL
ncbi:MAG: CBS domain-containing protein [Bacteroidetes bacterium]|nr:CBS domain-containing protein [Bacteroidota bacterium]